MSLCVARWSGCESLSVDVPLQFRGLTSTLFTSAPPPSVTSEGTIVCTTVRAASGGMLAVMVVKCHDTFLF